MRKSTYFQRLNQFLVLFSFVVLVTSCYRPPQDLKLALEKIPGVTVNVLEPDTFFKESFELWFTQPVDHNNPAGETFQQRVLIGHVGYDKPTVAILEGYSIYTEKPCELSRLLKQTKLL